MTSERGGTIHMYLTDGRMIDLSNLTIEEILAVMAVERITPEMVDRTEHILPAGTLPSITCPRCGATSYNRHDIEQEYCGSCHLFHEQMDGA